MSNELANSFMNNLTLPLLILLSFFPSNATRIVRISIGTINIKL